MLRSALDLSFATDTFLLVFWLVSFCVLTLAHEMGRALQSVARLHGRDFRNVVIVGEDQRAKTLAAYIEQQPTLGYRVLQIITTKDVEV